MLPKYVHLISFIPLKSVTFFWFGTLKFQNRKFPRSNKTPIILGELKTVNSAVKITSSFIEMRNAKKILKKMNVKCVK